MSEHLAAAGISPSNSEHLDRVLASFDGALVVLQNDNPIGLIKVQREPTEWELIQIQLLPLFQRQGIGGQLIGSLVKEARATEVALRLSVLKANPARHLYERMGFVVVTETAHSYTMALKA